MLGPDSRKTGHIFAAVAASLGLLAGACGSDSSTSPSPMATVTLAVGSETFRVALTTPLQVAAALAAWSEPEMNQSAFRDRWLDD